jgi:hypothetical protein
LGRSSVVDGDVPMPNVHVCQCVVDKIVGMCHEKKIPFPNPDCPDRSSLSRLFDRWAAFFPISVEKV